MRGFDFTMSKEMNNEMQEMNNEMQEMTNEMQEMIKTKGTNERMGDEPQAQDTFPNLREGVLCFNSQIVLLENSKV